MDQHDINGAKEVVLYLFRGGLKWYRTGRRTNSWDNTYKKIGTDYKIFMNEQEVKGTLLRGQNAGGVIEGETADRYILLAPPHNRSEVCLLGVRWKLAEESVELTLYLHLFGESPQKCVPIWHRGYRLELPHKQGVHCYTHVQPIRATGWQQRIPVPFAEQSVPDRYPAFPLKGQNLTTLCAALALALDAQDFPNLVGALQGLRKQNEVLRIFA